MYRNLAKLSFSHINKFAVILTALCAAFLAIFLPGLFSKAYVHPFGVILCLFAGPAALYGIYRMLYAILGGYQKRVRQYIAAAPDPALTQRQLEQAYAAGRNNGYLCIAGAWVFVQKGPETYLYETQEILWVYERSRTVRHGLFLQFNYHYLMVGLVNGQRLQFRMSEEQAEITMDLFRIHAPFVVRGYLESLATLFKRDLPEFIRLARSQQLQKDVVLDQNE